MVENQTEKFVIELSRDDVWVHIHTLRRHCLRDYVIEHCAMHKGWDTFMKNYRHEYELLEFYAHLINERTMFTTLKREWENKLHNYIQKKETR